MCVLGILLSCKSLKIDGQLRNDQLGSDIGAVHCTEILQRVGADLDGGVLKIQKEKIWRIASV